MTHDDPEPAEPLRSLVGELADAEELQTHPAAATLTTFDEDPAGLAPGTRRWIEAHVARCASCAAALRAVPRLELPPRRARRLLPLVAAAGWLCAALLAARALAPTSMPRPAFPVVHMLVLSTVRGAERPRAPEGAGLLRLALVLGEEVPLGTTLAVTLADEHGATLLASESRVSERNERDWPVLTLDRTGLPRGLVRLTVRTPSGLETGYELEL